ncbi:hypothetical protein Neosp_009394 [[Neocosmospora] mangrovei]
MAPFNLPILTVTGPNGEPEPVLVFGFPASEEELVPLWQWFETVEANQPSPDPDPAPASASASVPGSASETPSAPAFDIDNASYDKLMEHLAEVREDAASANQQALEDIAYSRLPETLAEYKTKRVPARDYVPDTCRVYGTQLKNRGCLKLHLGYKKIRGKHTIYCHKCKKLIAERAEEEDEEEEEAQPLRKKQKKS